MLKLMYVMISHSEPLGNPTGLICGSVSNEPIGVALGENLGENSFKDLHMPRIPICVLGKMYQSGLPSVVEKSAINCKGKVKLKSLW